MSAYRSYTLNRTNPFVLLAVLIGVIILLSWIAKGIFKILTLALPFVLIATAIINYRVLLGYGRWLGTTLRNNPIFGILAFLFTIFFFPIVAGYLLLKAIGSKGDESYSQTKAIPGEYISYEEVNEDFLDLSDVTDKKKDLDNEFKDVMP